MKPWVTVVLSSRVRLRTLLLPRGVGVDSELEPPLRQVPTILAGNIRLYRGEEQPKQCLFRCYDGRDI